MTFYKFWIADGICEKQFRRPAKELKTIDGTTYWFRDGERFEVWGVEQVWVSIRPSFAASIRSGKNPIKILKDLLT
jgi:hypothetical protein